MAAGAGAAAAAPVVKLWNDSTKAACAADPARFERDLGHFGEDWHEHGVVPRVPSLLSLFYPLDLEPGTDTGWGARDCSRPTCRQGWLDASVADAALTAFGGPASAGQGAYVCANGGNCTAPDLCACAPGWTGYDCRQPVCTLARSRALLAQLHTRDAAFVAAFEVLALDRQPAQRAGLWRRQYGPSHGTGLADALIAASAEAAGATLVTLNRRHFPMLEEVLVPYAKG
jgi:hypothetical protein